MAGKDNGDSALMDVIAHTIWAAVRKHRRDGHSWRIDMVLDDAMLRTRMSREQIMHFMRVQLQKGRQ